MAILILFIALCGLLTANPLLTAASVLTLALVTALLWRKREPPILFFVAAVQWLQVSLKVFHADFLGVSVKEMFGGGEISQAIWLGLSGILILALGARCALARLPRLTEPKMQEEASQFSVRRIWKVYLGFFIASISFKGLLRTIPQITQIGLAFLKLRWVMFFILAYTVLHRKRNKGYLIAAMVFELIIGITGFFSNFNDVLILVLIALLTVGYSLRPRNMVKVAAVAALIILFSTAWLSVRNEYRGYVSGGKEQQIITVPFKERLTKIMELSFSLDGRDLSNGLEALLERVAYVDMFAHVIKRVPSKIPHEGGKLWARAVKHVVLPRLLFPDKPRLASDTALTIEYTGLKLAGAERGTSIGMGYMAETYIDFGPLLMFAVIFALGLLYGLVYRYFAEQAKVKIFGYAVAVSILKDVFFFETDNAKLLGGILMGVIIMALALKFVAPWFISRIRVQKTG